MSCTETAFFDTVLEFLSLYFSGSNKSLEICKDFGDNFVDFRIETGTLSYIPEEVIDFVKLAENIFEFFLRFLVSFVLFVERIRKLSRLFCMGLQLYYQFIVIFNHFVDLSKYLFEYFFFLTSLCLLEVLVCLLFVVNFIKELLDIISQIFQLLLLSFDTLHSFS